MNISQLGGRPRSSNAFAMSFPVLFWALWSPWDVQDNGSEVLLTEPPKSKTTFLNILYPNGHWQDATLIWNHDGPS